MLLGWKEVDKTQSRRQSGLVCSLLVVSLLLSAVVGGEECACGFPSHDTVNMYGPPTRNEELNSTSASTLYIFPSMNFSCDGSITDIRMRMDFIEGLQSSQVQFAAFYFLLFHDELTTPNRSVTQILLSTEQYFDSSTQTLTEVYQTLNLLLPVTEGDFIGFAIPPNETSFIRKNINLSPTSERVEAHTHQLTKKFSEFMSQLSEVARTADSSQFATQMIAPPLIDVTFSPDSSTGLTPSPTSSSTPMATHPQSTPTPGSPPSQLMIIVIAVVATTVLLLVVVVVLVVVMVTVVCRRKIKEPVNENDDTDRGVSVHMTDNSTTYNEPMSLDVDPSHLDHQPHPLITPHINTSATGDYISMQECPAYQPIVDTPTSGEYTYI